MSSKVISDHKKPTRSTRLKKYGSVFREYLRNKSKSPIVEHKKYTRPDERHTRPDERHTKPDERHTRPDERHTRPDERHTKPVRPVRPEKALKQKTSKNLNTYQKFVQEESRKEKYKNMKGSERMLAISQAWEKKKRKDKKYKIA